MRSSSTWASSGSDCRSSDLSEPLDRRASHPQPSLSSAAPRPPVPTPRLARTEAKRTAHDVRSRSRTRETPRLFPGTTLANMNWRRGLHLEQNKHSLHPGPGIADDLPGPAHGKESTACPHGPSHWHQGHRIPALFHHKTAFRPHGHRDQEGIETRSTSPERALVPHGVREPAYPGRSRSRPG